MIEIDQFAELPYFNASLHQYLPESLTTSSVLISALVVTAIVLSERKHFDSQITHRTNHTGAGILPYSVQGNDVYFLLSKEGYFFSRDIWCDFGGKKDGEEETVVQTAAREAWEESRDILGDREAIQRAIFSAPSIGSKNYEMFFMKIEAPSSIENKNFLQRKFSDHHRMEKTQIEWVKADDVFRAVRKRNPLNDRLSSTWKSYVFGDTLRGCFAKTIYDALQNPQERKILEKVSKIDLAHFAQTT